MRSSLLALHLALTLTGCAREGQGGLDGTGPRGTLTIAAAAPLAPVVEGQAARFERLYPEAEVAVRPVMARQAFVALVAGQADAAVADRPMNAEERTAATAAGLDVTEVKLGVGALVVVAPEARGDSTLSLDALAEALRGEGPHHLALTSRNAGTVELLGALFLGGQAPRPAHRAEDEAAVLAWVAARPDGLGVVSLAAWARADADATRGLCLLALPDSSGHSVSPSPMSVYRGQYPLAQPIYLYVATHDRPLAAPFATFAAGVQGQEEVQRAGLVPVTLPAREIVLD